MSIFSPVSPTDMRSAISAVYVRALVVDSNAEDRRAVKRFLEALGWRVDIADDAHLATALSQTVRYEMIFVDGAMLKDLDMASSLRKLEAGRPRISIVEMLDENLPVNGGGSHVAGADDCVAKPLEPGRIQAAVDRWIKRNAQ